MKSITPFLAGMAIMACTSCVEVDGRLGGNFIPADNQYDIYSAEFPIEDVAMLPADSLSGFSQTKIAIGAVRDDVFGLSTRSCALTIVPLVDTVDFGNVQAIKSFSIKATFDTTSVSQQGQERILQNVYAAALEEGTELSKALDCNDVAEIIKHKNTNILKGTPILDGKTDLTLYFSEAFAWDYVNSLNGLVLEDDWDTMMEKMPGIYIWTDEPVGNGGRINTFDLQIQYNSTYYYLEDNYGEMVVSSIFGDETEPVDTSFYFYCGALDHVSMSDLMSDYSTGSYPQYALNLSKHESRSLAGASSDKLYVEGGGGLKPVIKASTLRELATKCIQDTLAAKGRPTSDFTKAIINKASIILPYEMPDDYTLVDNYFPPRLSPTCRIQTDTSSTFMGLTDASSENEDQGNINRSLCCYSPDITYHLQQLMLLSEDNEKLVRGNYDIWMLIQNLEETTTSTEGNSDLSEYYQYLAYQSYYNSMYGGYGYGSYGSSYSNYYSYMLASMYASGSTSTSTEYALDSNLYYGATLCGPTSPSDHPRMRLVFSIPKK